MNREEILYLVPYLLSLALTLGIFVYTWRHRHVRGARVYSWFVAGQTLAILGFIFELVSPNLQTKLLWDKFQWLTYSFLVFIPFLIFAVQFSEYKLRAPRLAWGYWIGVPLLFTLLLITDNLHHLIYPNPGLSTDYPFPELTYDFTPAVFAYSVFYIYGANIFGISLVIRRALQPYNLYKLQFWVIAIGFLIPLVLSMFTLLGVRITPQRDLAPFSLAVGNVVVAWGLFRYGLFDIVPIAREHIVENIRDPLFVLDAKNRVADVNQAALKMLGMKISQVIGQPSRVVFARWPIIVGELEFLDTERREIALQEGDDTFYYDVNISSIYSNKRRQLLGRIVAARDITRYKTLERGYRLLSEELEHRVQERTEELRNSAERYRAVVENQTEFIVRWKPDRTRTFVNDAYCRYFGLTFEQAMQTDFLTLIAEEDRQSVLDKIARLTSGETETETEVHRVPRPDGSIGWQEWTDQAIRDDEGTIIEFQSVGRDVTERKLAEENLLKQLAFDELMTRLLARFATCSYKEVDSSIEFGLKEITEFMGIDYADVLILSEDRKTWKITYQWSALQPTLSIHPTQIIAAGELLWSEIKLFQGEAIRINTFNDYPAEAQIDRRFTEDEGAKSLLSVPIQGQEKLTFGCIDLISYTNQVNWSDSDVTHMKIIGDSIANLLERKRAEENLAEAYDTTLEGWANALELRDKETEGHSRRVTESTLIVARALDIPESELEHIYRGAILHDIGKMGIPDHILRKNGPLTSTERAVVEKHPTTAFNLLKRIPYLEKALDIPYCHHEKWDGSGYPRGLQGEQIPLAARIFAVVDVWDALTSDRPYRKAWDREKTTQYLVHESGKHFDPGVVQVFLGLIEKGEI